MTQDHAAMLERATRVIPGGVYGHGNFMPPSHPRLYARGKGCRVWDVSGKEYIDLMCGYGPNLLGMAHPQVDAAAARQQALGDCFSGPTERMIELAELLCARIRHADWALFTKNGTDATTLLSTLARAATRRRKIAVAHGAYHGAAPWCTPSRAGVIDEDRSHLVEFEFNDAQSLEAALASAGDDLAGILISPFKHDSFVDQEMIDPTFAKHLRSACDEREALLLMDEVRAGFRLSTGGSWEHLGIEPDASAWGKALGNGYAISAIVAQDSLREAMTKIYSTGTFWYAAVPMAAALETQRILVDENVIPHLEAMGLRLRAGLDAQARAHGFSIRQTGPPQMPLVLFDQDDDHAVVTRFATEATQRGVFFHPWHNMFLCAAHREADIDEALEITDSAFRATRKALR